MPSLSWISLTAMLAVCAGCLLCHPYRCISPVRGSLPPITSDTSRLYLRSAQAPQFQRGRMLSQRNDADNDAMDKVKQFMLSSIKWYRREISPLMPPNCRFFPSCSNYALQAIEEFGAIRGGILTAWRIIRCNPTGGYGYDPPQWPPPGYFAGTGGKRMK